MLKTHSGGFGQSYKKIISQSKDNEFGAELREKRKVLQRFSDLVTVPNEFLTLTKDKIKRKMSNNPKTLKGILANMSLNIQKKINENQKGDAGSHFSNYPFRIFHKYVTI